MDELAAFTALLADNLRADDALAACVDDLNRILSRLMTVEALLATGESGRGKVAPLDPAVVTWLEGRIDAMQEALQPIDKFTIPGGHTAVSLCHVCRTVCRRSGTRGAPGRCEIRRRTVGAGLAEPSFGLFLPAPDAR